MDKQPKLIVSGFQSETQAEIRDLEQARYFPYGVNDLVILVEDEVVSSYEDVVRVAAEERNKGKALLDVKFLPLIEGG